MTRKRPWGREYLIREAWAARCMGLIMPGVHIDEVPKHCREMVRGARREWFKYKTDRALRFARGPMFPATNGGAE